MGVKGDLFGSSYVSCGTTFNKQKGIKPKPENLTHMLVLPDILS